MSAPRKKYQAVWNGTVLAESDQTIEVEGNQYFPPESVKAEYLAPSDLRTTCAWKGEAGYRTVTVDGQTNADAAWYYPEPSQAAAGIKNHFAFWKGVDVIEVPSGT